MEQNDSLTLFKQGNEYAFQCYYEQYYHALCLWVLRMIRDEREMHDMVQEAFVTLWQNRGTIESELHLKMFLYQVVRNRCINYLKNKKVEEKYVREYLKTEEELFESSVLEEELHRIIIQEIERLPEEQKKVVYLVHGYTVDTTFHILCDYHFRQHEIVSFQNIDRINNHTFSLDYTGVYNYCPYILQKQVAYREFRQVLKYYCSYLLKLKSDFCPIGISNTLITTYFND